MKAGTLLAALSLFVVSVSCSTTRALGDGEFRLASNKVEIEGKDHDLKISDISSYVKQQPNTYFMFGWNPFLNIYNWADPKSDKWPSTMWRKIGVAPVVFNPSLLPASEDNVLRHLATLGYYHARITEHVDTVRKLANVHYVVTPGPRCVIDSLVYKVPQGGIGDEFTADLVNTTVKVGDYLSENALDLECARSAAVLRNKGYYDFNKNNYFFIADTLGKRNVLNYEIREYTRNESPSSATPIRKFSFGEVTISHSPEVKFKDKILTELCLIKPGLTYNEDIVNSTYSRMAALKVFNNVSVELNPRDSVTVDCNIKLGESKLQGMKIDLEASTSSNGLIGISPQINFYHKNIFRGGEWLSLGFNGIFQFSPNSDAKSTEFGVNASLSLPRMVFFPYSMVKGPNVPRTEFKASYNYQNRPEFTRGITKMSMQYNGQVSPRLMFQLSPLSMSFVKLYKMSDEFYEAVVRNPYLYDTYYDHTDIGVSTLIFWTTSTDIVPKVPYRYISLGVDASGNIISLLGNMLKTNEYGDRLLFGLPISRYVRAELNLGKTFRFGYEDRQQLALHFVGGAGYSFGGITAMPFEKQFYAGGASSMRGWQARALGPGFSKVEQLFSIPSQTGDYKLEFDVEYRFPMVWKLEGAIFTEAGNVWAYEDNNKQYTESGEAVKAEPWVRSIAADWGIGLRVNLDFLVLRLDGGFKMYDPSRDIAERWLLPKQWFDRDGFSIHFGVGYPF